MLPLWLEKRFRTPLSPAWLARKRRSKPLRHANFSFHLLFFQIPVKLIARYRFAEKVALSIAATGFAEPVQLTLGFDPFRCCLDAKIASKA